MSKLSFLEKLLDGAEVEWKALEEVFNLRNGYTPSKAKIEYWTNGDIPWLRMEDLRKNGSMLNNAIQHVHKTGIKGKLFPANSIIMATTATIGEHALITVDYMSNQQFTNFAIRDEFYDILNIKFVYYYFFILGKKAKKSVNMSSFPSAKMNELKKWKIPIPCPDKPKKSLAIQAEIVRILDTFTELTAELTTELTTRKKQYNYYRDRLLSFEDGEVEWKALGEVAEYSKTRISFDQLYNTNYVGVDNLLQNRAGKADSNYVPISGNLTEYREGDTLIGNIRPYLKKIWHADCLGGANGDVLVIHPTDKKVSPRYLYQVLADDKFFDYDMKHAKGAKMPRGNKPKILDYPIPIPYPNDPKKSLAEQARIVAILDKFDTLTHSISEGLPREIELRQKQYAYYRDLLLNFPKPEELET